MNYFATIFTPNGQTVGDPVELDTSLDSSINLFQEQNTETSWNVDLKSKTFAWLSRPDAKAGRAIIAKE
ncbi:hypothetical protein M3899_003216 [Vibrio parahaemolyticus]|nr:hypothetical protein [Vibrio parahaemolyticus]